ncbi:MAG TPA: hypothetical protein DHW42_09385 [Candidatus Marinimicrobia bacterium]|nr:hypothetical protein [Candidatus Neomarinimicrobiota bacterium]
MLLKKLLLGISVLLIPVDFLAAENLLSEVLLDQFLDLQDITADEIESYLEQFTTNPLIWENCSAVEIEALPLSERLKEPLINLKARKISIRDWADFAQKTGLEPEEVEIVKLFFRITQKPGSNRISLLNFTSLVSDPEPDVNKNLVRGKIYYKDGGVAGVVAERDAGERTLWDYRNVSLRIPVVSYGVELGAAAFRFNWGHGLLFSRNGMPRKSINVSSTILPRTQQFGVYLGSDENRYMSGANFTYKKSGFTFYSMASNHYLDAAISDSGHGSFRTTGIHISDVELSGKNAITEKTFGAGLLYVSKDNQWGALAFRSQYSHPLKYYSGNNHIQGYSVYQKFSSGDWVFSGEGAFLNSGEFAVVQGCVFRQGGIKAGLQARYFSDQFFTSMSGAVKEFPSTPSNERGLYAGLSTKLLRFYQVSAYVDFFAKNRSFKAGVNPPKGTEALLFVQRRWKKQHFIDIRFKRSLTYQSAGEDILKNQISFSSRYYFMKNIWLSLRGATVRSNSTGIKKIGSGICLYSTFEQSRGVQITAGTTHFYCPTSDTRVYLFEPGTPLRFNMVSLYGTGYRRFMTVRQKFRKSIDLVATVKSQSKRGITENRFHDSFIIEFQMLVDL